MEVTYIQSRKSNLDPKHKIRKPASATVNSYFLENHSFEEGEAVEGELLPKIAVEERLAK